MAWLPAARKQSAREDPPQRGGGDAPEGQRPEHQRAPDTREAPQNAARESVPILAYLNRRAR
jgi:hypothetical protein